MKLKKIKVIFKEENKETKKTTEIKKEIYLNVNSIISILDVPTTKRTVIFTTGMQILADSPIEETIKLIND